MSLLACRGRHVDREDIADGSEILAELAVVHHLEEIAVGRRDDADVHVERLLCRRHVQFVFLKDAEEKRPWNSARFPRFHRGRWCRRQRFKPLRSLRAPVAPFSCPGVRFR